MSNGESSESDTNVQDDDADVQNYIKNIVKSEINSSIGNNNNNNNDQQQSNDTELGSLINQVNVLKGLKTAFESPFETAIIGHASDQFMNQIIPSMNAPAPQRNFMDSGFMMSVGNRLPDVLPTLMDVMFTRLGKEKAEQIINGVQDKWLGGGSSSNTNSNAESQNVSEFINSLNPDDPADLHQYMELRGLDDIEKAKNMLLQEKQNLASQNVTTNQTQDNQNVDKILADNNTVLKQLVSAIQEDRKFIKELSNKINTLEGEISESGNVNSKSEIVEESKTDFVNNDDKNKDFTKEVTTKTVVEEAVVEEAVVKEAVVKEAVIEEVDKNESIEYE